MKALQIKKSAHEEKKDKKKKNVRVCTVDKGRRGEGGAPFLLRLRDKVSIRPPQAGRKVDEEWVNTTVKIHHFFIIGKNSNPNPWISLYEYQPLGIKTNKGVLHGSKHPRHQGHLSKDTLRSVAEIFIQRIRIEYGVGV